MSDPSAAVAGAPTAGSGRRTALVIAWLCLTLPAVAVLVAGIQFWVRNRSTGSIVVEGMRRGYVLHVPRRLVGRRPVPLVISLHGAGLWGAAQRDISRWNDVADREGFIVAYPSGEGHGSPRAWATSPGPGLRRDVAFLSQLIDTLIARFHVDPRRVYVNGLSNGAGMTFALSCVAQGRIAAAGFVASALTHPWSECDGARPMPAIVIHGTRDPVVPYDGGSTWIGPEAFPSIPRWVRRWAQRNGCDDTPHDSAVSATVTRRAYTGCADGADVMLYTLRGEGHVWPGGGPLPRWLVGPDTSRFDATRAMWEFFRKVAERGRPDAEAAEPARSAKP